MIASATPTPLDPFEAADACAAFAWPPVPWSAAGAAPLPPVEMPVSRDFGGTSWPTGVTLPLAEKPQSSRWAASL